LGNPEKGTNLVDKPVKVTSNLGQAPSQAAKPLKQQVNETIKAVQENQLIDQYHSVEVSSAS